MFVEAWLMLASRQKRLRCFRLSLCQICTAGSLCSLSLWAHRTGGTEMIKTSANPAETRRCFLSSEKKTGQSDWDFTWTWRESFFYVKKNIKKNSSCTSMWGRCLVYTSPAEERKLSSFNYGLKLPLANVNHKIQQHNLKCSMTYFQCLPYFIDACNTLKPQLTVSGWKKACAHATLKIYSCLFCRKDAKSARSQKVRKVRNQNVTL